ncbi:MAG: YciI family protein [Acidimicrobiales bacterium]|jgi:hypothetical protein|nr:YciI family protein [Acidimicrobiales bacterium]
MHFVLHALDRPDSGELRSQTREEHLAYMSNFNIVYGGPLLDAEGDMCGSLIVTDMEHRSEMEAMAAGDPYALAGLFAQVTITGLKAVLGP